MSAGGRVDERTTSSASLTRCSIGRRPRDEPRRRSSAAGGERPVLDDPLAHGGQTHHLGDLVVVDADQRHVVGDGEAEVAGGDDGAEGHLVGEGEDGRRAVRPGRAARRPAWWPPSTVNSPVPMSSASRRSPASASASSTPAMRWPGTSKYAGASACAPSTPMRRWPRPSRCSDGDAADGDVVDAHRREARRLLADRHHTEPAARPRSATSSVSRATSTKISPSTRRSSAAAVSTAWRRVTAFGAVSTRRS